MLMSPPFLDTYSLSMLSLRCKVLCIVINFFVLWSICLSSFLVHFKNGPKYLIRGTAQILISLIRFLLGFKFPCSSEVHLIIFSFISVWWCPLPIFPSTSNFPPLQVFQCFPDLAVLFLLFFSLFSTFLYKHGTLFNVKLHSYILPVYANCLYRGFPFFFLHFGKYIIIHIYKAVIYVLGLCYLR